MRNADNTEEHESVRGESAKAGFGRPYFVAYLAIHVVDIIAVVGIFIAVKKRREGKEE